MMKILTSVQALLGFCAVAAPSLLITGQAFAESGSVEEDPQWTSLGSYIPRFISLQNLAASQGGKICVVGYSQSKTYDPTTNPVSNVPAYILTAGAGKHGAWTAMPAANARITALELGTDIASIGLAPNGGKYLNSGGVTFFLVKSSTIQCSSIFLKVKDQTKGTVDTPYYAYPRGLFEVSTYPVVIDTKKKTYIDLATIDTSNVDSFELPIQVNVAKLTQVQPPTMPPQWRMSPVANFGNPASTPGITRRSLISGADDKGGASSPFYKWLKQAPQVGVADDFLNLAYGTNTFPYAMIESPNDYLNLQCVPNIAPKSCTLNNEFVNLRDKLNSYFDAELQTFFTNAVNKTTGKKLAVMGDAHVPFAAEPWTAQVNNASCPLYLKPDKSSVTFQNKSQTASMILCNPVNQVQLFNPNSDPAPSQVTVTPQLEIVPEDDGFGEVPVPAYFANATITVTAKQCAEAEKQGRVGWNLGQQDTGFFANITRIDCAKNQLTGKVVGPASGPTGTTTQSYVCPYDSKTKKPECTTPNLSYKNWIYSNIPVVPGVNSSESASQMVFANDGAFAAWQPVLYASDASLQIVALSVARNIVEAFNRGIANCNNVTMSPKPTTGPCANVTALSASQMNPSSAASASDVYWSNEANFYPKGGVQNYYAQYLHTASVAVSGGQISAFLPPKLPISVSAKSNQGITMGMAYGFAYDENPGYLQSTPTSIANVPSKLDPIPSSWWPKPSDGYMILGVIIGRSD